MVLYLQNSIAPPGGQKSHGFAIFKGELLISSIDLHDSPIVGKWLVNSSGDTWPLKWDMVWNLVQFSH